jgi:hypothetical protein
MHFDLDTLLHAADHLECLTEPFTTEEIDIVVKNLPIDKSPSPDGFNTDFVKKVLVNHQAIFLLSMCSLSAGPFMFAEFEWFSHYFDPQNRWSQKSFRFQAYFSFEHFN